MAVQVLVSLSGRSADFREGLCQLVATAQLTRAPEWDKKSQPTRVRGFTGRHQEQARAALPSRPSRPARPVSGGHVFAAWMDAARGSPQQITEAFFEAGGQCRRNIGKDMLTSSIALKGQDSSRDRWSRCRLAVRRPGSPVASPRSHGMPCRGFMLGRACARLAVADNSDIPSSTDISEEVKRRFLPGLKAGVSTPRFR